MNDLKDSGREENELLSMLESMQDQIEALQDQNSDQQEKISQLSSENSILKSELQRKSEMIVSQNEQIGKLNESDLVLKQNELLEQKNKELQQSVEKAMTEAGAVKEACEEKEDILDNKIYWADRRIKEAEKLKQSYQEHIRDEAEKMITDTKTKLEEKYEQRSAKAEKKAEKNVDAVYGVTLGSIGYGVYITLLEAVKSPRFSSDFIDFVSAIGSFIMAWASFTSICAESVWALKEAIPISIIDVIVAGVLAVIVSLAIVLLPILILVFIVIFPLASFYKEEFWDLPSLVVALASLAILVIFADQMEDIPVNLIVLWGLLHAVYVVGRMMICDSKNRY